MYFAFFADTKIEQYVTNYSYICLMLCLLAY